MLAIIAIIAVLLIGSAVIIMLLYPSGAPAAAARSINVAASGSAGAYPAEATMYLTINGTGLTPRIAADSAALTLDQINATLMKYLDGNVSNMQTESYSLMKVYNQTEYQVVETFSIKIPNIKNASAALYAVSGINKNNVDGINAELSANQITALRAEALSEALSNATAQALVVSGSAGVYARNITIQNFRIYPLSYGGSKFQSTASPGTGGQQFFSSEEYVTEDVSVVFGYK